ncbi:hypothetical protein Mesil_3618 (plasmid) [Allomeiothermus silvanus DSM 9946]|uniref:Uncharacterized protein n=1 Tax=Allomeiothermus silvanus (strain ATCC 700542 / DSM 9946 / NBRC 106475 / NCIMB 13440 / VI-R2) TaxID=526227 RepID=D7BJQ2_ALLS1|nr:hypothetical protein [Allomeiothermus silvanus]ADH65408.1 hypothetical protein Mesil_3618 [Allomeiothermus silvanus DSM 9946]
MEHSQTLTLGVDLGLHKSYLAVVEPGQPARVVEVVGAENPQLTAALNRLLATYPIALAVVEGLTRRPLKGRMDSESFRALRRLGHRVSGLLLAQGIEVLRPRAVEAMGWQREEGPGWRQAFTGLTRPREQDVIRRLLELQQEGRLAGEVPRNPHAADAVGMALVGAA